MSDQVPYAERKTFLGMPGYGDISAAAGLGFYKASVHMHRVDLLYVHGSLLANNFNRLWCHALNKRHRGERCDYFAMQHSDVEPKPYWLDVARVELEERGLDVLSVVVPIKDDKGTTSVALARPDGNTWRPLCRLTMREVWRLPETFTSDDVGQPLLFNTGLWVCRFNPEWAERVHFEINDRIVFNTRFDCYMAETEPEDWNFSRQCHALGLKVGVTRKVPLMHLGLKQFPNTHAWGSEEFDSAYVKESQISKHPDHPEGWKFPNDVDGWLTYEEGVALANLAKGKRVLEIGSYCGKSTICMAQTAKHIVAVDPHDGRGTPFQKNTLGEMKENLKRYGVEGKVGIVKGTSADMDRPESPAKFDLAFIDGAHDIESVRTDIEVASGRLATGGLLSFHDYRKYPGQHDHGWDAGVTQAVDELLEAGGELVDHRGTVAVVRPPAMVPAVVA